MITYSLSNVLGNQSQETWAFCTKTGIIPASFKTSKQKKHHLSTNTAFLVLQFWRYGKLSLVKAGNPRRTSPLWSKFSTLPTGKKFWFK